MDDPKLPVEMSLPAGFPVKGGGTGSIEPESFGQQPGMPIDAPMQSDADLSPPQPSVREIYADRG